MIACFMFMTFSLISNSILRIIKLWDWELTDKGNKIFNLTLLHRKAAHHGPPCHVYCLQGLMVTEILCCVVQLEGSGSHIRKAQMLCQNQNQWGAIIEMLDESNNPWWVCCLCSPDPLWSHTVSTQPNIWYWRLFIQALQSPSDDDADFKGDIRAIR